MKTDGNAHHSGTARRVIGDLLILLVLLLIASVCVTMPRRIAAVVLKDDYRTVFRYQLILCGVLLLFALDVRFGFWTRFGVKALRIAGWAPRAAIAALTAVILFFGGKVIIGGMNRSPAPADHVIVLGMALEDGQPVPDLISRLDTARGYLEEHPSATLILTGGNADETGRTEAGVMKEILLERGVPEDRMIPEDRASDTKENFRNTAELIDPAQPVALITSNYHMDRAVRIAGEAGFTGCLRLPAPSDPFAYGANVLSEVVLDLNDLTK